MLEGTAAAQRGFRLWLSDPRGPNDESLDVDGKRMWVGDVVSI